MTETPADRGDVTSAPDAAGSREAGYRALFEQASDGIFFMDRAGTLLEVNPAACAALGFAPDELRGRNADELLEERPPGAPLLRSVRPGEVMTAERRIRRRDGTVVVAEVSARMLPDGRLLGIARDVTRRKMVQRKREELLTLLRATLESTADGVLVLDRENGLVTCNQRFLDMWRVPYHLLAARNARELFAFMSRRAPNPETFLEKLAAESDAAGATGFNVLRLTDGVVIEWASIPQLIGDEVIGRVCNFRDVTVRSLTEETLLRSEERYRSLVEHATYGIYRSTLDGRLLSVNPALVRMLGYDSPDELLRRDMMSLYATPSDRERLIREYAGTPQVRGVEAVWLRRDGTPVTVRLTGRPVRGADGRIEAFEMFVEDVTDRRELEVQLRQAQKMEAIGQLAGGIAHDFNNLLTAVMTNAELLAEALQPTDVDSRECVNEIRGVAVKGAAMVKKLLAVSRRDALEFVTVDLGTVCGDMVRMLRRLIPAHIEVRYVPPEIACHTAVDRGAVEQILLNLATNARDAMARGGTLTITTDHVPLDDDLVKLRVGEAAAGFVRVSIEDTGTGMDARTVAKVFEPFFTTKPPGAGTGLGMAMVYGLMQQHGGFVRVESAPGRGTRIELFFPERPGTVGVDHAEEPAVDLAGSETILIVEDNEAIRRTAPRLLARYGYTVLTAANGEDALEILRAGEPTVHLVVTDVVMPKLGGRPLYDAVKRMRGGPRFVFTSGHTRRDITDTAELDPAVPFLHKPWTTEQLLRAVRAALGAPAS